MALVLAMIGFGATAAGAGSSAPAGATGQLRVAQIGYRLAVRNAATCARTSAVHGLLLHDLGAYSAENRAAVQRTYGLGDGMGVLAIVAGAPANRAGLAPGDEIIALNDMPVTRLPLPPLTRAAAYDRVEAFQTLLADGLTQGAVTLTVRRGAERRIVSLPLERGCAALVTMVPGEKPGAWSDRRYAAVTEGLVRAAGDDELAFALAHEMAHVILGHAAEPHGPLTEIGIGGKRSRDRERAADQLGMAMAVKAGFDPAGAEALLKRLAQASGPAISLTHPSLRSRIEALRASAKSLESDPHGTDHPQ